MNKLNENILDNAKKGSEDTNNASIETTSATTSATSTASTAIARSSDTYIYGVCILSVLAIGVGIFFAYNNKAGQVIHDEPIKRKRRHTL